MGATTLVLAALFVPVAFLAGITGELYRQFAVTILVTIAFSTINPLRPTPKHKTGAFAKLNGGLDATRRFYLRLFSIFARPQSRDHRRSLRRDRRRHLRLQSRSADGLYSGRGPGDVCS